MALNLHKFGDRLVECKHVSSMHQDLSAVTILIPAISGKSIVICDIIIRAISLDVGLFDGLDAANADDPFYKFITPASSGNDSDTAAGGFTAPLMITEGNPVYVKAGGNSTLNTILLTYYYI